MEKVTINKPCDHCMFNEICRYEPQTHKAVKAMETIKMDAIFSCTIEIKCDKIKMEKK